MSLPRSRTRPNARVLRQPLLKTERRHEQGEPTQGCAACCGGSNGRLAGPSSFGWLLLVLPGSGAGGGGQERQRCTLRNQRAATGWSRFDSPPCRPIRSDSRRSSAAAARLHLVFLRRRAPSLWPERSELHVRGGVRQGERHVRGGVGQGERHVRSRVCQSARPCGGSQGESRHGRLVSCVRCEDGNREGLHGAAGNESVRRVDNGGRRGRGCGYPPGSAPGSRHGGGRCTRRSCRHGSPIQP